jgi:phospholipid/cholesterol/gamma-HCH transport system substrate-binding protein
MLAEEKSNVRLGLFVLAGSFFLIMTLYMIGKNQNFFGSNFALMARFKNVNGLTRGDNIRFSGIQVGTVKSIKLINDTTIEVIMLIDHQMMPYIHKNAVASIGTEGLMGNKIVNILPGTQTGQSIEEGDLLPTEKIISTDEMLQTLDKTNSNIAEISENLKTAVLRLDSSKALWGILNDASLALNMKTSLDNIREASVHANGMVTELQGIVTDVKNGKGLVGSLLTDTSLAFSLVDAVAKIKLVGERATGLIEEVNGIAGNIQRDVLYGPGAAHSLLNDSVMAKKLSLSLDNIQKGTEAFSQDMEALKHNFLFRGYFRKLQKQQELSSK